MDQQPWGDSAQSALRWAFKMLGVSPTVATALDGLYSRSAAPVEMSKLDRYAQAAVIRAEVDSLDNPAAKAYLWAAYLPKPMLERQPGRKAREMVDRFPEARGRHVQAVAWWLMGQEGTGMHRIRGYQEIVAQYTCGEESIDRLRVLLGVSPQRATEARQRCYERLEALHEQALRLMDDRLHRAGLLGQTEEAGQQS